MKQLQKLKMEQINNQFAKQDHGPETEDLGKKFNGPLPQSVDVLRSKTYEEFSRSKRYQLVKKTDGKWLKKAENRMETDAPNAQSTWGEIRAYATLLMLPGFDVCPNSQENGEGFDFTLKGKGSRSDIAVEVFTQGYKPNCILPNEVNQDNLSTWVTEAIVRPLVNHGSDSFKRIAPSDFSIIKYSIDVIGNIKKEEKQVGNCPNILYIDFESVWGIKVQNAFPLLSFQDCLSSSVLWMAFYGEQGTPIFDNRSLNEPCSTADRKMTHPGRFVGKCPSRFDGVLMRMPHNCDNPLVFYENPHSRRTKELENFKISLIQSGLLYLEASCMGWGKCDLLQSIKKRNQWLRELAASTMAQKNIKQCI